MRDVNVGVDMGLTTVTTTGGENAALVPVETACRVASVKLASCLARANFGGGARRDLAQAELASRQVAKSTADAALDTALRSVLAARTPPISVPTGAVVARAGTTITVEA